VGFKFLNISTPLNKSAFDRMHYPYTVRLERLTGTESMKKLPAFIKPKVSSPSLQNLTLDPALSQLIPGCTFHTLLLKCTFSLLYSGLRSLFYVKFTNHNFVGIFMSHMRAICPAH
jgi:hypothetical protein